MALFIHYPLTVLCVVGTALAALPVWPHLSTSGGLPRLLQESLCVGLPLNSLVTFLVLWYSFPYFISLLFWNTFFKGNFWYNILLRFSENSHIIPEYHHFVGCFLFSYLMLSIVFPFPLVHSLPPPSSFLFSHISSCLSSDYFQWYNFYSLQDFGREFGEYISIYISINNSFKF